MKKLLLLALVLTFISKTFSQDSKVSFELNYPIPVGDNFIENGYNGIIDLGVDYKFANLNPVNIGVSLNGGLLKNNVGDDFKITSYTLQPRIFGELNLESLPKIHPSIGIGYTVMIFDVSRPLDDDVDNQNGFNLNFGVSYDINNRFFTQIQYDFIKLGKEDDIPNTSFNRNVNILKVGLGYKL
ncbi:hypothetical protein AWE51_20845 [Aquimarina aggregata]|uniref:Outer membrane protein beta-barrel domain-containing protein n=1 Tax=Aquimarina aggregata TaxID=1642818 RepID=A0A163BW82_9FLAO|nr:outer membrane beta-barrel protein [Aquimarina aggregata]KZS41845.1 hypothetical protein AWE51_20845 [Aquimarina aggregata]